LSVRPRDEDPHARTPPRLPPCSIFNPLEPPETFARKNPDTLPEPRGSVARKTRGDREKPPAPSTISPDSKPIANS
jgi:hypothetical protein